jgi:hypothetical protein
MQRDEEDCTPRKPLTPCLVCGTPTDVHPICERWQLCLPCVSDWFEDKRFGSDLQANIAATPGWIAEKRAARMRGAA